MLADEVQALADELRSAQVRRGGPRGRRPASANARARPRTAVALAVPVDARPRAGRHVGGARVAAEGAAPPARSARVRQQASTGTRSGLARMIGGRRRGAGQGGRGAAGGGAAGGRECAAGRPPGPAGERARRRAGAAPAARPALRGTSAAPRPARRRCGRGHRAPQERILRRRRPPRRPASQNYAQAHRVARCLTQARRPTCSAQRLRLGAAHAAMLPRRRAVRA